MTGCPPTRAQAKYLVKLDTDETQFHPEVRCQALVVGLATRSCCHGLQWLAGPFGDIQANIDHLLLTKGCVSHMRALPTKPTDHCTGQ